VQSRSEQSLE